MFIWLNIYNLNLFCPSKLNFDISSWIINEHFWKITFSVHIIKYSIFYINIWKIDIIDIKYDFAESKVHLVDWRKWKHSQIFATAFTLIGLR